jgi:hypothetical protein
LFKKADVILIAALVLVCLIFVLAVYLIPFEGKPVVNVYIDNELIDSFDLEDEDEEYREVEIETQYGYNLLIVSEGIAFIDESDCHTGSCVSSKVISRPGSMIICAPHHLVIKIETVPDEVTNE